MNKEERKRLIAEFENKLWQEAKEECKVKGHNLVMVRSGLFDIETPGMTYDEYECTNCNNTVFYFLQGTKITNPFFSSDEDTITKA
jgi:hypothetical protein